MLALAHIWMLAAALLLDALVGDPDWLWRRVPHPAALIGRLIARLDRDANRDADSPVARRLAGVAVMAIVVVWAYVVGFLLELLFSALPYGWIGTVVCAAILLAGRSLEIHVRAVHDAFAEGGLDAARMAVSRIVGRDPNTLDEAGVSRAAIESLAENFSDAVVAPALWFAVLGLPGMLAYKAINTADSMIGHLSPRHRDFGWAAARLDDLVNLPASRIAGGLLALAAPAVGGSIATAFAVMRRDARQHRSPNAGWPESAMAGALGIALLGPRVYEGRLSAAPYQNAEGRTATPADIRRGLIVYVVAGAILLAVATIAGAFVIDLG